jgi:hypothetical protein
MKEYVTDLIADFLWKSNAEYGFKKFAKEDAESLIRYLSENGFIIKQEED